MPGTENMTHRIDTHHHIIPGFYREWILSKGVDPAGRGFPAWSPEDDLAVLDANEIAAAIVSISTPGVDLADTPAEAQAMARRLNEFSADLARANPERYGFYACLPLPDLDAALAELDYARSTLRADGVCLHANTQGVYLGDPTLDPLFDELQHRAMVVSVHPSTLPGPPPAGVPAYAADFLLDTVRAALVLARSGTLERCPDVKLILSHGGGFLPYAGARLSGLAAQEDAATGYGDVALGFQRLQRFYMDTALASSNYSLPSLSAWTPPEQILYGTDYPFAPAQIVELFTAALDQYDSADYGAVTRRNALALFPRLTENGK
jgi:6-methylsalicylate decarboxylase